MSPEVIPHGWSAVLSSFALVVAAEMGDKTQLLAFSLASRFRRPWTVMAGILVATVANHGLASTVGVWISGHVPARVMALVLAEKGQSACYGLPDRLRDRSAPEEKQFPRVEDQ